MKPILLSLLVLAGCCTNPIIPEPKIIKEVSYVVKIPPKETMTLPPEVEKVNIDTATQADAARFLIDLYDRNKKLENQLIAVAKFLDKEQSDLDAKAKEENISAKNTAKK